MLGGECESEGDGLVVAFVGVVVHLVDAGGRRIPPDLKGPSVAEPLFSQGWAAASAHIPDPGFGSCRHTDVPLCLHSQQLRGREDPF